jgi:hypothetical protein
MLEKDFQNKNTNFNGYGKTYQGEKADYKDYRQLKYSQIDQLTKNLRLARQSAFMQATSYTTTERDELQPIQGQLIFNTTTSKFQGYDGTSWNDFH